MPITEFAISAYVMGIGLIIGSFLNVVIYRLPKMVEAEYDADSPYQSMTLSLPHSHCPACNHRLTALDLVPVFSWLFLRGKCRHCGAGIRPRYPAVELLIGMVALICYRHWGLDWAALAAFTMITMLVAAFAIDLETMWLPDRLTQPLAWAGLLAAASGHSPAGVGIVDAVYGAAGAFLLLFTVDQLMTLIKGYPALGGGDSKLMLALGAWLGIEHALQMLLAAIGLGLIFGLILSIKRRLDPETDLSEPGYFPFGPALAVAGVGMLSYLA